jgi:hypothetical protein
MAELSLKTKINPFASKSARIENYHAKIHHNQKRLQITSIENYVLSIHALACLYHAYAKRDDKCTFMRKQHCNRDFQNIFENNAAMNLNGRRNHFIMRTIV